MLIILRQKYHCRYLSNFVYFRKWVQFIDVTVSQNYRLIRTIEKKVIEDASKYNIRVYLFLPLKFKIEILIISLNKIIMKLK